MQYEAAIEGSDGSFLLLTTSAVNAFGHASMWVNQGLRVMMVRDTDGQGVIIYTVTACEA